MVEKTKLATRKELESMNVSALIVQKEKRRILMGQMVGTLYPRIVADELERIEELLEGCRSGYSEPPQEKGT